VLRILAITRLLDVFAGRTPVAIAPDASGPALLALTSPAPCGLLAARHRLEK
jgi:hypothetical protein